MRTKIVHVPEAYVRPLAFGGTGDRSVNIHALLMVSTIIPFQKAVRKLCI
jgi:hypothetical protein